MQTRAHGAPLHALVALEARARSANASRADTHRTGGGPTAVSRRAAGDEPPSKPGGTDAGSRGAATEARASSPARGRPDRVRIGLAAAVLLGTSAVACSKRAEPVEQRTAPWPAHASTVAVRHEPVRYQLEPNGQALFTLGAPQRNLRGRVRVSRGEIELDLADLKRLRGRIGMDLGSLVIDGEDGELSRQESAIAQNWLNLGASRPEAERERLRWSEFRIGRVVSASADDVFGARRAPPPSRTSEQNAPPARAEPGAPPDPSDARGGDGAPAGDARRAELTLEGPLELLGYRVERRLEVALIAEWPEHAERGSAPTRVSLETTKPFSVYLAEHDIVPRDSLGTLVSTELRRIGSDVGREAKVTLSCVGYRAR